MFWFFFFKRVIGFLFEVVLILDISRDLVKKVFLFNIVIFYVLILLFYVVEVWDMIKNKELYLWSNKSVLDFKINI